MLLLRHLHFKMYTLNKDGELIMVKKIGIALLCAAFGTSLQARDDISISKLFVGLELSSTKVDSSAELFVVNSFGDEVATLNKVTAVGDSTIEYGIRLGAEKDDWRTTIAYSYLNSDTNGFEETMHKGSLLLDYFIWSSGSDTYNVKPYLGAHIGYLGYEATIYDTNYNVNQVLMDDTGFFYGGQAGLALMISDVVELDVSYRYSFTSIDDIVDTRPTNVPGYWYDTVASVDQMGSIVFAINYFY